MKWSLFSWKKPAELAPGDYQQVKTNVNNNTTQITNLRNLLTTTQNDLNNVKANYLTTNTTQTITGAKTFNGTIIVPEPTNNNNPATKQYVDQAVANNNNVPTNMVTLNTEQTITSLKTFNASPVGLKLKQAAGRDDKQYLIFANKDNTTTFSLGSDLSGTAFELNRGHLTIQAKEANKNVIFDNVSKVEFNNTVPQFGQNISAGWGGGVCKFLPEDNSTKTLQFFETNNTSQRRFKLAVPEPVDNNNPATKQYVDNQISSAVNAGPFIRYQDLRISTWNQAPGDWGIYYVYTVDMEYTDTIFLGATVHYPSDMWGRSVEFSYNFGSNPNRIYFNFRYQKADNRGLPPLDTTFIRVFYAGNINTLSDNGPFSIVPPEVNNEN